MLTNRRWPEHRYEHFTSLLTAVYFKPCNKDNGTGTGKMNLHCAGGVNKQRVSKHNFSFVSVANVVRQPFNASVHSVPRQGIAGPII